MHVSVGTVLCHRLLSHVAPPTGQRGCLMGLKGINERYSRT
uniref:Uncharacterized protein n=1 Tax=Anguilla anguilla TaxID=7936 RepID=A0A0E9RJQ0_ANGAN